MTDSASATQSGKLAMADAARRAPLPDGCSLALDALPLDLLPLDVLALDVLPLHVKFDFGADWANFDIPALAPAVTQSQDRNPSMRRSEVRYARCQGYLGGVLHHPSETMGSRYAPSGVPLQFKPGGT